MAALTLAERATLETVTLNKAVMAYFSQHGEVFNRLPIKNISGNAYAYSDTESLPGTAFRGLFQGYTESHGVINRRTERLAILGGDSDTDVYEIQTTGESLGSLRSTRLQQKMQSAEMTFADTFFNGIESVNQYAFDGLKTRLAGANVISATAGFSTAGFLNDLDALLGVVDADAIYAPKAVQAGFAALLRSLGQAPEVSAQVNGKRVPAWNGVPILCPGDTVAGAPILPLDPTNGGDVYAVKFARNDAEAGVMGITNGGVQARDLGEVDDKPVQRHRVEFYCGITVRSGRAAARLAGVKR